MTLIIVDKNATKEANDVLQFVKTFISKYHYPPTLREIGKGCDMSHSKARTVLEKLIELGYIKRTSGAARGLVVVPDVEDTPA